MRDAWCIGATLAYRYWLGAAVLTSISRNHELRSTFKSNAGMLADYIERLRQEILLRWREAVRRDPEQSAEIQQLDDKELEDHLPALTDKIIALLRNEPAQGLEEDAAAHGRQRRTLSYSVVALLRELQIFPRCSARYGPGNCRKNFDYRRKRARA